MKHTSTLTWDEINDLINEVDLVDLADNLSYENLVKLEYAYIVKDRRSHFKDEERIENVLDLAQYLYLKDEEEHSKSWYVDRINYLVEEKNFSVDDLAYTSKSVLFDMVYNPEDYLHKMGRER